MPLKQLANFFSTFQPKTKISTNTVRAAVLCPLYIEDGVLKILFIKRSQTVKAHKGEISFPGGVKETRDFSLEVTSTRETEEEIGVKESDITIFGGLDEVNTTTGFLVSPFVGTIPHPYQFKLSVDEVDNLISLAIDDFLEPHNEIDFYYFNGRNLQPQLAYNVNGQVIWGATAKIMGQFLELGKEHNLFTKPETQAFHLAS
ncbi:MAG: coenzyme A pyrophosphatase [Deltaproteobacteria bacterium]|nr:MAG: coenzyme A pyrophosphatase [Deltaproteobacteria bacterium]